MFFDEVKIFLRHGRQSVPDLRSAGISPLFRGRPVISPGITAEEIARVVKVCPTGAITGDPVSIDLGKCLFCNECHFTVPEKITFTNDYRIGTNRRERLIIGSGDENSIKLDPDHVRKEIRSFFRHALKLRQVSAGGDNSNEMELNAAGNVNFDMGRFGIEFVASPRHADGIVITGPVTVNMSRALRITYDAVPDPKIIILAGTDAVSGGVFAGSPALDRTFPEKYPVDLYLPGNPVHPLTFINGVMDMIGKK